MKPHTLELAMFYEGGYNITRYVKNITEGRLMAKNILKNRPDIVNVIVRGYTAEHFVWIHVDRESEVREIYNL